MDYNIGKFNFNPFILPRIIQSNILLVVIVVLFLLKTFTLLVAVNFPQNIFFADITKAALESFTNQTRQAFKKLISYKALIHW